MEWKEFETTFSVKLNQQQKEAVQSTKGPVLLLAVPGSGKTTVLVTRLGYMIYAKGIAPEKILRHRSHNTPSTPLFLSCAPCD